MLRSHNSPLIPLEEIKKCLNLMDRNHEMHNNPMFKAEGIFKFMSYSFQLADLKFDNTTVLKGVSIAKDLIIGKSDQSLVIAFKDKVKSEFQIEGFFQSTLGDAGQNVEKYIK